MILHKLNEDQQAVIDALIYGHYKQVEPYMNGVWTFEIEDSTSTGTTRRLQFSWLHDLGDGKDVMIIREKQPEWFARRVRGLLNR